jgi:hypothetical protein
MSELKGYSITELIRFAGSGFAFVQVREAKKANYQRLCEKYYQTKDKKIGEKITKLEKELEYSMSYVELLND